MPVKRARLYDVFALLTVILVVALDQWTKSLVVTHLSFGSEVPLPVVGQYLVLQYIRNTGAAFSMLSGGNVLLPLLIGAAILVVIVLYVRMLNTGSLGYKLVFGLIVGGALGNLLDRLLRGGSVVDFISFRIPEIHYYFAIFNISDACISVGVVLLFVIVLFGNTGKSATKANVTHQETPQPSSSDVQDG